MKLLPRKKYLLKINYKSKTSIKILTYGYSFDQHPDRSLINADIKPVKKDILFFNIPEIESIELLDSGRWL